MKDNFQISDIETLERLYGKPAEASIKKEIAYVHPHYQRFIEASPFAVIATSGPEGLDVSPRGDQIGFVQVENEKTLLLPDRRGNNRIDSLRNIISDPRVAVIFFVPGIGETLRVNGKAEILIDPALLHRFSVDGKVPRSVLRIHVESVFFQCSRAVMRSRLWEADQHIDRSALPSLGTILSDLTMGELDGKQYDKELPDRLKTTMY
ncbi:pyridoxamine 5'-phosphate oxidase family protein [Noviherbaspirillum saxi]|uniref:Pyridoxamine 5'-phosphate oxidase family protein n=1 Tax=Noviherbaspirillum saxi TaxID=2320863 RepID=A0A3A3FNT8_9BURK|nr:pyridoxamine 5'-phosphate oxidase family protein [Noviherbaspirillum saxi]RJF95339.1 pyridoxamine 5'-phosphate oxidase family protein [Noviherbaspirillum saxi]